MLLLVWPCSPLAQHLCKENHKPFSPETNSSGNYLLLPWQIRKIVNKKILFVSNGHGEDVNASAIANALGQLDPTVQIGAMPTVGAGNAYRRLGIEIIGPTKAEIPSGGFSYAHPGLLVADIADGLIGRLGRQVAAVRSYSRDASLILAMGDEVVLAIANLAKRPFFSFLCSTSAHYEKRLRISPLRQALLRPCQRIYTRDALTAESMRARGFSQSVFVGNPFMDALVPSGLDLPTGQPLLAMLPGSRLPEAAANLEILLELALAIARFPGSSPPLCWLALTPNFLTADPLPLNALAAPWKVLPVSDSSYQLVHPEITVYFSTTAFADILERSTVVVGMAGTAIEQAVGLGKAVVQIPGRGPQFTYAFAEAQSRLLGEAILTIGKKPANAATIEEAAQTIGRIIGDAEYLEKCRIAGQGRVGGRGAANQIAQDILANINNRHSEAMDFSTGQ
jgi:uncharacterized protein (TIGR03492 family)